MIEPIAKQLGPFGVRPHAGNNEGQHVWNALLAYSQDVALRCLEARRADVGTPNLHRQQRKEKNKRTDRHQLDFCFGALLRHHVFLPMPPKDLSVELLGERKNQGCTPHCNAAQRGSLYGRTKITAADERSSTEGITDIRSTLFTAVSFVNRRRSAHLYRMQLFPKELLSEGARTAVQQCIVYAYTLKTTSAAS